MHRKTWLGNLKKAHAWQPATQNE